MNGYNPSDFRYRAQRPGVERATTGEVGRLDVRTLSSSALFQGDHEIGIEHHGALYRLKITRQGKLILNK